MAGWDRAAEGDQSLGKKVPAVSDYGRHPFHGQEETICRETGRI